MTHYTEGNLLRGLTVLIPVAVFPFLQNIFETPKSVILLLGVLILCSVQKLNTPNIVKALIAFNLFSLFYTHNYYYTKIAVVLNISCFLVYVITSGADDAEGLLFMTVIAGSIVGLTAWIDFFRGDPVASTIGNSNYVGSYLIFPLFAMIGLSFRTKLILLFTPLIFGGFLIARARASWIGFFIGVAVFIIIWKPRIILPLVLGVLIVGYFNPNKSLESFHERFYGYWPAAVEIWKQSPVIGTGMWSYRNLVYDAQARRYKKDNTIFDKYKTPKPRRAHNEYLEALVDGGVIYFGLFFYLIISTLYGGISYVRKKQNFILLACICSIIAILINAVFFFPFRLNVTLFQTFLTLGIIKGLSCRKLA